MNSGLGRYINRAEEGGPRVGQKKMGNQKTGRNGNGETSGQVKIGRENKETRNPMESETS
jgi:hypothetical protein